MKDIDIDMRLTLILKMNLKTRHGIFWFISRLVTRDNRAYKSPLVYWCSVSSEFKSRPLAPHPLFSSFIKPQKSNRKNNGKS